MAGKKSTLEKTELTKLEKARIHYLFLCLFSEGSKFLIMYIIFHALHMTGEYLITLFVLLSVRNFSGGIHLKHYTGLKGAGAQSCNRKSDPTGGSFTVVYHRSCHLYKPPGSVTGTEQSISPHRGGDHTDLFGIISLYENTYLP